MTSRILRASAVAAAVAACSLASTAHAAENPAPVQLSQADMQAASQAATSSTAHRLAAQVAKIAGSSAESASSAEQSLAPADAAPVQVNSLSAEFVASGSGPVATPAYVATTTSVAGHAVTLWSMRTASGWKAVNAADGAEEAALVAKADGAPTFREPQINAWYALQGDTVVPLNDSARQSVGDGMSVADYQKLVHGRYGDKLPGSAYAKSSMGGGFAAAAARPAESGSSPAAPAAAVAGVGGLALAGGLLARRRRTRS